MDETQEFLRALQKDPSLISRLKKREELENFKEKYNVEKTTPLKCPVCASISQYPRSLYIGRNDHTKFVCRKCKLVYTLICHTLPNDELIDNLRSIAKGDKEATLNWYRKINGGLT